MRAPLILLFFLVLFISIFPSCLQHNENIAIYKDTNEFKTLAKRLYVDFDTSMQTIRYKDNLDKHNYHTFLSFLKYRYETNSLKKIKPQKTNKIPKIFHYIWFGRKLPKEYLPILQTWIDKHPTWTFIFWVDNPQNYNLGTLMNDFTFKDIKKYLNKKNNKEQKIVIDIKNLSFKNRTFFDKAKNYGQQSDILKWEIVYRYGGAYIEVDLECIKPLDILHHTYDFYTGIIPLDTSFLQLGSALFAAKPKHPILKHCVETIKDDWERVQIIVSTGPLHFTKSFCSKMGKNGMIDVAFPASYFYPCGYQEKKLPKESWLKPESFAVHHWAGSWLKPEGWRKKPKKKEIKT